MRYLIESDGTRLLPSIRTFSTFVPSGTCETCAACPLRPGKMMARITNATFIDPPTLKSQRGIANQRLNRSKYGTRELEAHRIALTARHAYDFDSSEKI